MSDLTAKEHLRNHQRQLDPDGIEVGVSRQALDEVLDQADKIQGLVEALQTISVMTVDMDGRLIDPSEWMRDIAKEALTAYKEGK